MRLGIAPATLRALPAVGAAIALGLASVLPAPSAGAVASAGAGPRDGIR